MKTTTILGALALAGATACGAVPVATVDFTAPTGPTPAPPRTTASTPPRPISPCSPRFQNTCLDQSYYYGSGCRGKGPLTASVKGMDGARVLSAHVLDHTRDLEPVAVEWKDVTLSLPRKDDNSAAFFVVFKR